MPVQTRSQTANAKIVAEAIQQEKRFKMFLERRSKIIEENNYANSEVFAVLRKARQALSEDDFSILLSKILYLTTLRTTTFIWTECNIQKQVWTPDLYSRIIIWFGDLVKLLTTNSWIKVLPDLDSDDLQITITWENSQPMLEDHWVDLVCGKLSNPISVSIPVSYLDF